MEEKFLGISKEDWKVILGIFLVLEGAVSLYLGGPILFQIGRLIRIGIGLALVMKSI
jgi:hypothetical protein